jgi:hypothetical protein
MPRVIVAPSALNPALRNVHEFQGDVGAFVRERYPHIRRWSFQTDGVDHYAVGIPADPISAAIAAINWWAVAASVAMSFVSGKLLAKKPPAGVTRSMDQSAASPTYSIGALQNQARLGAAIPVIYGEVTMLPDYAAQPYVEFKDNEQYLKAIYCVGHGNVEVPKMFAGETDVAALGVDVVYWQVFTPTDHASTFGTIAAATGVDENIFSNSEVSDQTLEGSTATGAPVPADWSWHLIPRASAAFPIYQHKDELKAIPKPVMGAEVGVGVDQPDGSTLTMNAVARPDLLGDVIPDPTPATVYKPIGPFDMCKPGQKGTEAAVDVVFAGGLYAQNKTSGAFENWIVEIKFTFIPIDDNGAVTGAAIEHRHTFNAATNTPQRYTLKYTLPLGRYRCKAERITAASTIHPNVSDAATWTGLKFKLSAPTHPVYGDVTLVAATIKATNGIASDATGKVRLRCRRRLSNIDNAPDTFTANPVDVMVDIMSSKYGGRRPKTADEYDLPELRRSHTKWAAHNGFNAVFDKVTTVWDAMASALHVVAAVPLPQGNRMSIAHDSVKDFRAALFTDDNIVAGSLQVNYEFDKIGDPEATRVEYRTKEWFDPDFIMLPPNRDDFESVNLFGCTDKTVAEQHATLTNNRRRLRRKTVQFETELDGALVSHGQRIGVAHSTPKWGLSAQVVERNGNTLTMNKAIDWSIPNLTMLIRDVEGVPHQVRGITQGATPKHVVMSADPGFVIPTIDGGYEGAIAAFGEANHEVKDWIVLAMEPVSEFRIRISAAEYRPDVYVNAMPHQLIDSTVTP